MAARSYSRESTSHSFPQSSNYLFCSYDTRMVKQYRCVCWAHSKAPACLCGCLYGCLCRWHESVQGRRKPGEIRHPWGIPRQNPSPSAAFAAGPPPESHESNQRRRFRVRRAMKQPKGDAYSRRMPRIHPRATPPCSARQEITQGRRLLEAHAMKHPKGGAYSRLMA